MVNIIASALSYQVFTFVRAANLKEYMQKGEQCKLLQNQYIGIDMSNPYLCSSAPR